jgi:hypothetical protein
MLSEGRPGIDHIFSLIDGMYSLYEILVLTLIPIVQANSD